jgi:predicted metalloprotease with PDZ domain
MQLVRAVTFSFLLGVAAPAFADVDYRIDLTQPDHHEGSVEIVFPAAGGSTLDIRMPAWRTGRYTILNLANGVRGFQARDSQGRPLRWEKIDKSTWRIHRRGNAPVKVGYTVFANELGLRTRHIDDSHAYLDASAVFMYAERHRKEPVTVSLAMPQGWRAFSGMEPRGDAGFAASNWDVLVDSPIEAGPHQLREFDVDGRKYQLVIWGSGNHDGDRMVSDFKKMIPQSQTIWKGYPFQRYLFIVHATDGASGATEHMNSTVIQMSRYRFGSGSGYYSFLSTASHEFIHTWNVKAYRNAAMVPYDYQRENYTDLLWIAEGSTEYFTDHLLLRAGIIGTADYFANLAEAIAANKDRPGRLVQSIAEASFDEWIAPSGNRANNASVNIYSEGAIASWALDIALLQRTSGKVSYRDVHQLLYQRFGAGRKGYTAADIKAALRELTGQDWTAWWTTYIDRPSDVNFAELLAPVGLRLETPTKGEVANAGWSAGSSNAGLRLIGVSRDGPAWAAGLETDDILVAIDGKQVTEQRFGEMLAQYRPGDVVTVTYFRRDQLSERKMKLGGKAAGPTRIVTVDQPSEAQKALFQRWLLVPYPVK